MKIINQTESELVTKDGNIFSTILGIIFIIIGLGIFLNSGTKNIIFVGAFVVFGIFILFSYFHGLKGFLYNGPAVI